MLLYKLNHQHKINVQIILIVNGIYFFIYSETIFPIHSILNIQHISSNLMNVGNIGWLFIIVWDQYSVFWQTIWNRKNRICECLLKETGINIYSIVTWNYQHKNEDSSPTLVFKEINNGGNAGGPVGGQTSYLHRLYYDTGIWIVLPYIT